MIQEREPLAAWTWVQVVLTSRTESLVVIKPNVSSFRDVELAAVYRVYRACMGWKRRVKPYKVVARVTVCCLDSCDGHERDVGVRFQVGVFTQDKNDRKFAHFSDCNTLFCIATTTVWVAALRHSTEISSRGKCVLRYLRYSKTVLILESYLHLLPCGYGNRPRLRMKHCCDLRRR